MAYRLLIVCNHRPREPQFNRVVPSTYASYAYSFQFYNNEVYSGYATPHQFKD